MKESASLVVLPYTERPSSVESSTGIPLHDLLQANAEGRGLVYKVYRVDKSSYQTGAHSTTCETQKSVSVDTHVFKTGYG